MKILFVHQNFPAQYRHLAPFLASDPLHQVISIGERREDRIRWVKGIPGLRHITYEPPKRNAETTPYFLRGLEAHMHRGQKVARVALELRREGFIPDIICAHPGWGESLYLKDVFPESTLLNYYEFYYRVRGADMGFDPEFPVLVDQMFHVPMRNTTQLLSLANSDWGISPTEWQRTQFPRVWRDVISVIHEGIDTDMVRPNSNVAFSPEGVNGAFTRSSEVVTYAARNLEPYRGFHVFMRALPSVLRRRPNAHVLIVGGDEISYGRKPGGTRTWREALMGELGADLDLTRVHFLDKIPYPAFIRLLQVSSVHVYLTVPFILSWSLLEAMSSGCLIVGSRTPPVQEVLEDGINALLVDFLSPSSIADRVVEALESRDSFRNLRIQARRTVLERFDLKAVCLPQHLSLLKKLVNGP